MLPAGAQATSDRCMVLQARSEERARIVAGGGPRVVVIGDSYSVGAGLDDPGDSWPAYLPGEVHVDGFSGSGFTRGASKCAGVSYGDRAPRLRATAQSVVVVEGGLNDYRSGTAEIEAGVRRVVAALRGFHVFVVGPAMAPSRAQAVDRVDAAMARAAREAGVDYVSTKSWDLEFLPDRLHLTALGHRDFGRHVAAALETSVTG
jgi:acyl-CoA thioesterase-1